METEVALHPLSNHLTNANHMVTEEDLQMADKLVEDVRDSIHEYQVSSTPNLT